MTRSWIITDGKAGMESQCRGLAERLGLDPVVKRVRLRFPWKQLSPALLRIGNRFALSPDGDGLDGALPDILIATGRQSVAPSLAVGELTGGRCFRIQIQNPGIDPKRFDLVVTPRHDRLAGDNVILTRGALHGVTQKKLAAAGARFAARLASLPHPRIAVLIGGSNNVYRLTAERSARLADQLAALSNETGGALLVTASRRTGAANEAVLRAKLAERPGEMWDGVGENPYFAYLDAADAIVVTGDSVNMVCEAAATGKPVHVVALEGGSDKFRRFHEGLEADGITRPFKGVLESWTYPPLDDTGLVAAEIVRRLAERGLRLDPA